MARITRKRVAYHKNYVVHLLYMVQGNLKTQYIIS